MGPALNGGPWQKAATDLIGVGQFWATYKATDWLTVTGGKIENPFITTSLVWDGDLNPEGFAEKFTFKTADVDWFLTIGEFMYLQNGLANTFTGGAGTKNDVWMFGIQGGGKWKITKDLSLQVAPTLYTYANASSLSGSFSPTLTGAGANNITGVNQLNVVDIPVEFAFPIGKIPAKIFGDFAINLQGSERANSASTVAGIPLHSDQDKAYQIGVAVGTNKKKGDWQLKGYWQHQELYALDPNLVDSDLFDSRLNMEGFVFSGQYMFTDFLSGVLTYAHASAIKNDLPTLTGTGDLGGNLRNYDLFQVDLIWKF